MKIGDKYFYEGIEYTILEIEENTLHLIDANGNGICIIK
jgi:hypothetical protein